MTEKKLTFSVTALWHIANIIESRYTNDLFNYIMPAHKSVPMFLDRAGYHLDHIPSIKINLFEVLKNIQSATENNERNSIVDIIEQLCNPEEFIGEPLNNQQEILKKVNEILTLYEYMIYQNGKIKRLTIDQLITYQKARRAEAAPASRFEIRKFHQEIGIHGRKPFLKGDYETAIFECCKAFDRYVSQKSKIEASGKSLMGKALSLEKGVLRINSSLTDTDKDEQEGLMHLCLGLVSAIRNPQGHDPKLNRPATMEDTLDILTLISFLFRQIDKAKYTGSQ